MQNPASASSRLRQWKNWLSSQTRRAQPYSDNLKGSDKQYGFERSNDNHVGRKVHAKYNQQSTSCCRPRHAVRFVYLRSGFRTPNSFLLPMVVFTPLESSLMWSLRILCPTVLALFILNSVAHADVKLPAIIGDNMVLQLGNELPFWGWAEAGEQVTVTVGGKPVMA